jgi:hypothetical protein
LGPEYRYEKCSEEVRPDGNVSTQGLKKETVQGLTHGNANSTEIKEKVIGIISSTEILIKMTDDPVKRSSNGNGN